MVDARLTMDGILVVIMVVGQWSVLFKDNPLYRLTVNVYLGCYMGYQSVIMINNIIRSGWTPLVAGKDFTLIIPLILGVLAFSKFSKKAFYLSRFPISFLVGLTTATMMTGWLDAMIMKQISATITIFTGVTAPFDILSTLIFIVSFITSILFFVFSTPITQLKPMAYITKTGRYFLMLMLGCYYASVVQMRISQALPAFMFLLTGTRG